MSVFARRRRRNRTWAIVLVAIIAVFVVGQVLVRVSTDYLWFSSVGASEVFSTQWATRVALFVIFFAVDLAWVGGNMHLAYRWRPGFQAQRTSPMLLQYRAGMDRHHAVAIWLPAAFVALWGALSGAGRAQQFLAALNSTDFGTKDPYSGLDASFFVFTYPVVRYLVSHAIALSIIGLLAAGTVHLTVGGFQGLWHRRRAGDSWRAPAHMSVGMAVVLVFLGLSALLDRYSYQITSNSLFTGMSYTDQHARLGAKLAVAIIAFLCAAMLLVNARLRRWSLAWAALVLLLVTSIILFGIYPSLVQRFRVRPSEPAMESSYIATNIAATRQGYDVADTKVTTDYAATGTAGAGQLKQDTDTLASVRLLDPAVVAPTFEALQQKRGYYTFPSDLDIDHYTLGGQQTDVVVAAREIADDAIPDRTWSNVHTVYTHGFGLVAAYGNKTDGDEPVWAAGGLPPSGAISITQPRIYFGEDSSNYVVVGAPQGTAPVELDQPGSDDAGGDATLSTYTGKGGVAIGSWFMRLLYAVRLGDPNLVLSGRVNSQSRILTDREPLERVQKVAPWLVTDSDPYPTVVNGRIVWVIDGYTETANYPNSQQVDWVEATRSSTTSALLGRPDQTVNYVRNSVKAVVDAYDGTVTLYAWDESDPILKTWEKVYPDLVQPRSSIPKALLSHLRYPTDLFTVQRGILARYHTTDPTAWIQKSDLWQVPDDPTRQGNSAQPPYYVTLRMPDEKDAVYSLTSVFTPNGRPNLIAYLAVDADASSPGYGQLQIVRMSDSVQVPGPAQTYNAINTNEAVAARLRPFLGQGSSTATYGNLLALPVGGGILYVVPVYTQISGTSGSYPALRFVVVRFGEHVGIGDTLQEALDQVFAGDSGATLGTGPSTPSDASTDAAVKQAQQLLAKAQSAWQAADKALQSGDLATYAKQVDAAQSYTEQAANALKGH